MPIKLFSAAVAVVLVLSYLGAIVFKLKEFSLAAVALIGIVMMLVDLWQSLQKAEE